jgi:hypothetical protein
MLDTMLVAASQGVLTKAIDLAIEGATQALTRAKEHDQEDVLYMLGCLEAARIAVWGLAQEREQILSDAAVCDLANEQQSKELSTRIDSYLRQNRLRPILETAIEKLRGCGELLKQRTEKILHWPWWGREDRQVALDEVSALLIELVKFLDGLGNRLKYLNPSGIGAVQLLGLEQALEYRNLDFQHARLLVTAAVNEARNDFTNREWLDLTIRMEAIAMTLRLAFR